MIDNFSIFLSHALLALALWRLMHRADLDAEDPPLPDEDPAGFAARAKNAFSPANNVTDA
ncbi:hypothetical protein [Sphingorhabdus sp.]|uniref:hypothetical protein n=1 Tax=Sphingorhabdus sp. TaxID=1902408 RepID=UPI00391CDC67